MAYIDETVEQSADRDVLEGSASLVIKPLAAQDQEVLFRRKVMEHYRHVCANCGSDEKVSVYLLVPVEAGGQLSLTNGSTLCRVCQAATKAVTRAHDKGKVAKSPVNVWVSRTLYDTLEVCISSGRGFSSVATLLRYLIESYVEAPNKFEDLDLWQDESEDRVRLGFLVPTALYEEFKTRVVSEGLTVTDAVKGMLKWYVSVPDVVVQRSSK